MKDMTERISRGDINRERFEAIKVFNSIRPDIDSADGGSGNV